jgi:hypothetical protein
MVHGSNRIVIFSHNKLVNLISTQYFLLTTNLPASPPRDPLNATVCFLCPSIVVNVSPLWQRRNGWFLYWSRKWVRATTHLTEEEVALDQALWLAESKTRAKPSTRIDSKCQTFFHAAPPRPLSGGEGADGPAANCITFFFCFLGKTFIIHFWSKIFLKKDFDTAELLTRKPSA